MLICTVVSGWNQPDTKNIIVINDKNPIFGDKAKNNKLGSDVREFYTVSSLNNIQKFNL